MDSRLTYQQALNRATALCSRSEKCNSEVRALFNNWGLSAEEAGKALNYLEKERFLDEQRYADYFVHDKFHLNKWGRYKIIYMLRMKKISEVMINKALESISAEEYEHAIRHLLAMKAKTIKGANTRDKLSRLITFAQGRGYEGDLVFRIAEEIFAVED